MVKKFPAAILRKMRDYPEFYQKVWRACAGIPTGETRTYGEIARQIGRPRAARAVGQALAKNPFAPRVPCHRVVGKNGRLTGYSAVGGIDSKLRILVREGISPHKFRR